MKVGDRLMCKKSYGKIRAHITEGKRYKIHTLYIGEPRWGGHVAVAIIDNFGEYCYFNHPIDNYFYTEKEVRRMKLKKINNEGRR